MPQPVCSNKFPGEENIAQQILLETHNQSERPDVIATFLDSTTPNELAASINRKLALWKHTGKLDLLRRFLLGFTKSANLLAISAQNRSIFISQESFLTSSSSLSIWIFPIVAGLVEPLLSRFPKYNRKYLPILNGLFMLIENTLLKLYLISVFFCGLESNEVCIQSKKYIIAGIIIAISPLSLLAGYMEFSKLSQSQKNNSSSNTTIRCINSKEKKYKIVFSGVNAILAMMSLISVINIVLKMSAQKELPLAAELIPAGLAGIGAAILQYQFEKTHTRLFKGGYFLTEFLRPTLENAAGCYVVLQKITNLILHMAVAAPIILILNLVRALDAYRYQFTLPDELKLLRKQEVSSLLISQGAFGRSESRDSIFNGPNLMSNT